MEPEAWPTPQTPARDPLPRIEDLPVAEEGYEQESVKAAFESFYRHAAQLDASLRTLEAVESFHRHAAALRSDLRALRTAGWTQQSWSAPSRSYGYGMPAPREGIPPVVWRVAGEVAFLIAVAVALGLANLSWWVIILAMAAALAIVCAIEWLAGREETAFGRAAPAAPVHHPVVEAQRADDTEEHDALGWTAFEEAQEPSDAMTIIGAPAPEEVAAVPPETGEEAEDEEAEPEPELPPAAKQPVRAERGPVEGIRGNQDVPPSSAEEVDIPTAEGQEEPGRRWWRRGAEKEPEAQEQHEPPSHVRVLSAGEDPWEEGFDDPAGGEVDETTEEDGIVEEPARRRFRRR